VVPPNAPATVNDPAASLQELQQTAFWGRFALTTQLPNVGNVNGAAIVGVNPASAPSYTAMRPGDLAYVSATSSLYMLVTRGTIVGNDAEWTLLPGTDAGIFWFVPTGTTIAVLTNKQYLLRGPLVLDGTAMMQLQGTAKLVVL
jgi:hypothetical protein